MQARMSRNPVMIEPFALQTLRKSAEQGAVPSGTTGCTLLDPRCSCRSVRRTLSLSPLYQTLLPGSDLTDCLGKEESWSTSRS